MDEVSGGNTRKPFEVESSLHFYPGELTEQNNRLIYNGQAVARLALPPGATLHIANGQDRPDGGWMATGYGNRTPAPVLRIRLTEKLPLHLGMLFPWKASATMRSSPWRSARWMWRSPPTGFSAPREKRRSTSIPCAGNSCSAVRKKSKPMRCA